MEQDRELYNCSQVMDAEVEVKWNTKVQNGLKRIPDDVLYGIAKQTLDMSQPYIPMSNTPNHKGTLRRATMSGGVRGGSGDYYIGSYTNYASSVWKMENVNWTTPGTNNKWFARTLKKHQATITNNAVNQAWRKDMQ